LSSQVVCFRKIIQHEICDHNNAWTKKNEEKNNPESIQFRLQLLKQKRRELIARSSQRQNTYNIQSPTHTESLDSYQHNSIVQVKSSGGQTNQVENDNAIIADHSFIDCDMDASTKIRVRVRDKQQFDSSSCDK
jgi:hypothetical protein